MKTDRLVDELVAELKPVRPRRLASEGSFLLSGRGRGHAEEAMDSMPSFLWNLGSLAILAAVSVVVALRSLDPAQSTRRGFGMIAALVALILLFGGVIDIATVHAARPLWQRLEIGDGLQCMVSIGILSIPPIVALGWLMRRAAPTDLHRSALSIGIASAALGSFLFVFACPDSDPLYVMIWFMLGCAIVAVVGKLALPLINRW